MTTCAALASILDDYLDGTLSAEERAAVERHLADCPDCRAEVESVRGILADARTLPRSVRPTRDLWAGIAPRLVGRPTRAFPQMPRLALQMAAAIGLILLGAALATAWRGRLPDRFVADQARYNAASAVLAEELAREPGVLSPDTRAVVQRNLAIVDAAIKEAETALAADPGNQTLEQMLIVRYEQRLALLRRATSSDRRES